MLVDTSLSNTIIHSPGGNPLHATEDVQATFLIRLGEYLNHLRHDQLEIALKLEEKMQNSDDENLNHEWRNKVIDIYRKYNDTFPENFKIKCKTTKMQDDDGNMVEYPNSDSFLCMLDYFRNILVHLPLKG